MLRAQKNRFGSTSKVGVYEMLETGLKPVLNPSTILLDDRKAGLSGTAIASTFEGQKTFLVEVQALVTPAVYGTPQRNSNGYNTKRLNMLLAILEKKAGFSLATKDVFLNITGGIKIVDPAIDLAVVMAILSSNNDFPINTKICFSGELGLSGEIRPVAKIEQRIKEAEKIGFESIIISKYSKITESFKKIKIIKFSKIESLIEYIFK